MSEVSSGISVSGMLAFQRQLDVISNNIANSATTGFRRAHADLTDLGYQAGITAPVGPNGANVRLNGVGEGTGVADLHHDFTPGAFQVTNNPLDVAIQGDAFLNVQMPDGSTRYTRDGSFSLAANGQLVTSAGLPVLGTNGPLQAPANTLDAHLDTDGSLHVTDADGNDQTVGQLALTSFTNPRGLLADGGNLWEATPDAGQATAVTAGTGRVNLAPGALEGSNVDLSDEFTRMIQAQRGYQVNMRMVQTWDQLEQMANNLRQA